MTSTVVTSFLPSNTWPYQVSYYGQLICMRGVLVPSWVYDSSVEHAGRELLTAFMLTAPENPSQYIGPSSKAAAKDEGYAIQPGHESV